MAWVNSETLYVYVNHGPFGRFDYEEEGIQ